MNYQEEAVNMSGSNMSSNRPSNHDISAEKIIPRTLSPRATERRTMSPNTSQMSPSKAKKGNTSIDIMENSVDSARNPMLVSPDHKDYQRYKYYSALRTGYAHLGIEQPELEPPTSVIDKKLFMLQLPGGKCHRS